MSYQCFRCEREFRWKASFNRHNRRKTPCRKAQYSCSDCNKDFVSHQSLSKHKSLYCVFRVKGETLSSILASLHDRDGMLSNNRSLESFLDALDVPSMVTPNATIKKELPSESILASWNVPLKTELPSDVTTQELPDRLTQDAAVQSEVLNDISHNENVDTLFCFDEILMGWMDQILQMEGKFRGDVFIQGECAKVLDRMLQDGLIQSFEHGNLTYSTNLFFRVHELIHMGPRIADRTELVESLLKLYDVGRISKSALVKILIDF